MEVISISEYIIFKINRDRLRHNIRHYDNFRVDQMIFDYKDIYGQTYGRTSLNCLRKLYWAFGSEASPL